MSSNKDTNTSQTSTSQATQEDASLPSDTNNETGSDPQTQTNTRDSQLLPQANDQAVVDSHTSNGTSTPQGVGGSLVQVQETLVGQYLAINNPEEAEERGLGSFFDGSESK